MKCKNDGCPNKPGRTGWCGTHRSRIQKYGSPNPPELAHFVGTRILLAKTCPRCGELRSDYHRRKGGHWRSYCKGCVYLDNRERTKRRGYDVGRKRSNSRRQNTNIYQRQYQDTSLPGATNIYQPYTSTEWDVILREDITIMEKAKILHRTFKGIDNALQRHRRAMK